MTLFDENSVLPPLPPDQAGSSESPAEPAPSASQATPSTADLPLAGDPITLAATLPSVVLSHKPPVPEDLRISWSWVHLVLFLFFGFASLFIVQGGFLLYYAPTRHFSNEKDFERFVLSKPQFAIGSMVLWYALIFLFLYVTLSVLRGFPFWPSR